MTEWKEIEPLDWYSAHEIIRIPSIRQVEAYKVSALGGLDVNINRSYLGDIPDGYQIVTHRTFAFNVPRGSEDILRDFVTNLEKMYLLELLGAESTTSSIDHFFKPEGGKYPVTTHEFMEDIADADYDELLKKRVDGKDIYYFQRARWAICDGKARARFNFVIWEKPAHEILESHEFVFDFRRCWYINEGLKKIFSIEAIEANDASWLIQSIEEDNPENYEYGFYFVDTISPEFEKQLLFYIEDKLNG